MSFLAQVTYTGNGSTTQYSITFPFLDSSHVKAFINGIATTDFSISSSTLTFTTAPANSAVVRIERQTPINTRIVDFTDGSVLTESDLDKSADQNFYVAQEITDVSLSTMKIDTDDKFDAQSKVIKNVSNPVNNNDAVNKTYLENTWLSTANKTALTTVNANIANINAVNSNSSNINSAVSNATNINTVATNIGSVNTVATDITKVIAVANDLAEAVSEVETVADDLNEATSEIDTVATNIANVNAVGTNITNVNTVAGINSDVTSVAGISSDIQAINNIKLAISNVSSISPAVSLVNGNSANINTVAGNNSNISTVAGISGNVTTVAGISSDVTSVANDATDIGTVAGNNTNISTVAGISSDVTTVAGISSDVQAVENIALNVTTVAGMSTAINTANSNSSNINTVAGAITNVNNVGGSIANVNTVAGNLASVNAFGETYRIASSAPTTSLNSGDLYFNTSTNVLNVYGASGWQNAGSSVNGTSQRYNYTATNAQTTFTGADNNGNTLAYDAGYIDVYLNGVKLLNGTDVTVTSGSSVVLASGATTGDVVDIVAYGTFTVASLNADNLDSGTVPDARITGAYTGITSATINAGNVADSTPLIIKGGETDLSPLPQTVGMLFGYSGASGYNKTGLINEFETSAGLSALHIVNNSTANSSDATKSDKRITIDYNGDISFYEDTGTTAKLFWDASAERLGIGTSSPSTSLHISQSVPIITLTDTDTSVSHQLSGQSGSSHLNLKVDTGGLSGSPVFNLSMQDSIKLSILNDGNVGIGTTTPSQKLDVVGSIEVSDGIYIGGTGTANKLDDYEEGTWTPTAYSGITGLSINGSQNTYTKVGRLVTVYCEINGFTGKSSGTLNIGGLPFTPDSTSLYLHGAIDSDGGSLGVARTNSTTGRINFYRSGTTNSSRQVFIGTNLGSGARISLTYFSA